MTTKIIDYIGIDEGELDDIVVKLRKKDIDINLKIFLNKVENLTQEIIRIANENKTWIKIANKNVFYNTRNKGIYPNFKEFKFSNKKFNPDQFNNEFEGYKGKLIDAEERKVIYEYILPWYDEDDVYLCCETDDARKLNGEDCTHIPVYRLSRLNDSWNAVLLQLISEKLIPQELSGENLETFKIMLEISEEEPLIFNLNKNNYIEIDEDEYINSTNTISLSGKNIKNDLISSQPIEFDESMQKEFVDDIYDKLLNCEKTRSDLMEYNMKMLEDPNEGHWDALSLQNRGEYKVKLDKPIFYRPPHMDIKKNATVAIDFGTKSTIVMFENERGQVMPLRIGTGDYLEAKNSKQYENPTVLNFIDLKRFMKDYSEEVGRPSTKWEDLTTSHTAYESRKSQQAGDTYYSFLYEIKQWAGNKKKSIRIKDKYADMVLNDYLTLTDEQFDPIEIYAYYIGLAINNMHNSGSIFTDYVLSYPATYEKAIRDKLVQSFTKGIKKALPATITEDTEIKVRVGASEPVAYAICAMEQFGFEPDDDEKIYYGIFDFGGGTSDFDFGTFSASEDVRDRYDYILRSFGDSGDRTLGGENLLELLAFEVFKANNEKLLLDDKTYVAFTLPEDCSAFLGSEVLISDSQEAKVNMSILIEKLRPYWEGNAENLVTVDEFGEEIQGENSNNNIIKCIFLDNDGEQKEVELTANSEFIKGILSKRIERGVRSFFESMILAMKLSEETQKMECIHIFLAGNSSKSPILKEKFDECIEIYADKFKNEYPKWKNMFKIYPPLGTEEAKSIQKDNGVTNITETSPTGKTGVAYGILKSRSGGKIKLISETKSSDELKFRYFIGSAKRGKFKPISNRGCDYNEWHLLIDAREEDFTIYYTDSPLALDGKMPVSDVLMHKCSLSEVYECGYVFYRAVSPECIEYMVSEIDESNDTPTEQLLEPIKITLGE